MLEKWKTKVAVVTGSSSGIGFATFKELTKNGIIAIGLDVFPEKTEQLIKDEKLNGFAYKCNVGNQNEVEEVFKKIEEKFGAVNILINNAGIGRWNLIKIKINSQFSSLRKAEILDDKEESLQSMNQVINTNFCGVLNCTRKAFKLMGNDYGIIININSVAGHCVPFASFSMNTYAPSKFAVTALTETIRQELFRAGNRKVRVAVKK